ncbi:serine hydrolase domain-containing protein [Rossellomorea vietnamensis]|uniref:serine hydrolase domain-containing protein n=1 Tax=Rossellomorea vietnamensis TaxID=218284 RepID=UPI00308B9BB3|nr:serine hydrolase domain-containing protein [Rossellomorea vietnamensis]WQI98230.1 serine hydrolase domain-containing protein [Rossellomorea vietnamensis]
MEADKRSFQDITKYTEEIKKKMHASGAALVIMKDNEVVHEWYSGTHHFDTGARKIDHLSQFNVYSTRVTYVGLAAALAIYEGYLNLDDKLSDYFKQFDKRILGETTVRHLVTRCTGLKIKNDSVQRVFDSGTSIEGKRPDLLAEIVEQATGRTVNAILSERVFEPLGWKSTEWATEGKSTLVCDIHSPGTHPSIRIGSNIGDERNLFVSSRELALWGSLHLNKGLMDGKQILPEGVFNLATTIQSPKWHDQTLPRFGFFWWLKDNQVSWEYNELGTELPEGSYQILGASGCSCLVIPRYNAVAVRMYNSLYTYENKNFDYIQDIQTFGNLVVQELKGGRKNKF